MNRIYMVTTFTKMEKDDLGWPNTGSSNFIGWFSTERRAREFVINNECDIWETIYDYALIEEWYEGYSGYTLSAYWYKYNREIDKYEPILAPECTKNYCGFTNPWGK